ncbi:NADH-quinone oxidoreductase subunit J family protein [Sphingobacterium spiritivorum]|uniref:NADH-quinone oxidoreductase subunit J family protein n=1 Tax=Sphingobacterium TaxID=28453 RepID=UPI00191A6C48|nr:MULTISPECIES: NADH-quinone oxidoreductase subunit J [Sphingobacterium]QQT27454.1 NADH-quinone oxidoreductase subunit J [Sphingobacterium spiritivorum]
MTIFYFVAFLSIFFALMTIFTKNPVHSVLYLVITFFTFTVHYILLNAQFLAVVNFIVYMGAIMVLFLFVLMLLNLNKESEPMRSGVVKIMGAVAGMCLLVVVLGSLRIIEIDNGDVVAQPSIGLVKELGVVLFDKFLLPFEISSILLLTAMVGAVLLAKKDTKKVNG